MSRAKFMQKLKSLALVSTGGSLVFCGLNILKGNEKFYDDFVIPFIQKIPPETSHKLAVLGCKYKIFPSPKCDDPKTLETNFFGYNLKNPIGIAAGFDKQGEAVEGLQKIGFGFVEIGSVTPKSQLGNPKPRVFRLPLDKAIINRYGFNSDGHDVVYDRIKQLKENGNFKGVLGVNLGKNKTSDDALSDYVKGVELFGNIADYLVINVSSPNTPGLRNLQNKNDLKNLLSGVITARNNLPEKHNKIPILLKLAPDLTKDDIKDIISVIKDKSCQIDGLIISNTTIDKSNLLTNDEIKNEIGGLSGLPLKSKSTQLIAEIYSQTKGSIPIIGVGGIFNGQDAFDKIQAGATYIQLYTSFIYHGPPIVTKIKTELDEILRKEGYKNISEAVGKKYKEFLKK